jgi:hypothetical protein
MINFQSIVYVFYRTEQSSFDVKYIDFMKTKGWY